MSRNPKKGSTARRPEGRRASLSRESAGESVAEGAVGIAASARAIPDPEDLMLAQARTCGARKRDLALFHPSELIALVWFANVPMVSRPGDPNQGFLFDRFNQHVTAFWNAYRKHPEKSLLLVGRIRGSLFDRRWAAVIQALAENPGATDREISERVGVLTGGMPLDTETTKKYRQRMFKAAARSGPEDGFARAMKKLKELGLLESNLVGAIIRQEEGKGTNRGE